MHINDFEMIVILYQMNKIYIKNVRTYFKVIPQYCIAHPYCA